jgi:hypothetical protein
MTLKTWSGPAGWKESLSRSTTICIADDDVGAGGFDEKPWWICLAQTGPERTLRTDLPGRRLLLSQNEAMKFVRYLLDYNLLGIDMEAQKVWIVEPPKPKRVGKKSKVSRRKR